MTMKRKRVCVICGSWPNTIHRTFQQSMERGEYHRWCELILSDLWVCLCERGSLTQPEVYPGVELSLDCNQSCITNQVSSPLLIDPTGE